jgi:hypothetical protein
MSQQESSELNEFVDRYIAVWHESDTDLRRRGVASLWAEDGSYANEVSECRGHAAIEAVVTSAHEEFVAQGYVFTCSKAVGHHNVVRLYWDMVPASGGEVESAGFDFFILGDDGRIRSDYQFTDMLPSF